MTSVLRQQLDWRRSQVEELASMGYSMREIAQILQIDKSAVNRDIHFIRQQAQENIKNHVQEKMPQEYHMVEVSINHVLKKAWHIANTTVDERIKLQALSLVKECNTHKLDMITNGTVVSDALKYVNGKVEKFKLESESESKESEEPDYGEEEELEENQDTRELEDKEEKTTNNVF